jgi:chromosome segregation ATPase
MKDEMNAMIRTHQEELSMLQLSILSKQETLSESESNMTAIGTYVDRLEDRLTSFAVTRRDMEEREKRCKEIEEAAAVIESEKKDLQAKAETYSKEQDELKKLLEELVMERANLQKDNRKLATDGEFRIEEQEQMQTKYTSLECEVKELTEALEELRSKSDALTPALEASKQTNLELQDRVERAIEQETQLGKIQYENSDLQNELRLLKEENNRLGAGLVDTTELLKNLQETKDKEDAVRETTPPVALSLQPRNVPFRAVRKQLSKATGIHGAITPSSVLSLEPRNVPFRAVRKQLSKATGIHGAITPSSSMLTGKPPERAPPSSNEMVQNAQTIRSRPPHPPPLPPGN